ADSAAHAGPSLDWMFAEYRADRRYTRLDVHTKRNHETGFRMVGGYVMKDGRKLGTMPLASITTAVTHALYQKLPILLTAPRTLCEAAAPGNGIEPERRPPVNPAMNSGRRAWNVPRRRNPGKVPLDNPFARMGLASSDRETPTASYAELQAFRAKAREMDLP